MTTATDNNRRASYGVAGLPRRTTSVVVLFVALDGAVLLVRGEWATVTPPTGQHRFMPDDGTATMLGYVDPSDPDGYLSAQRLAAAAGWRPVAPWTTLGRKPACIVARRPQGTPIERDHR